MNKKLLIGLILSGAIITGAFIFGNHKKVASPSSLGSINSKPSTVQPANTKIDLTDMCKNLPIDKIDQIIGKQHTGVKSGQNIINGAIGNYYCDINYTDNLKVAITYEVGNFEHHLESLATLDIKYQEYNDLKHKAIVETEVTNGGSFKIDDNHYLGLHTTKPIDIEQIKGILKVLDQEF